MRHILIVIIAFTFLVVTSLFLYSQTTTSVDMTPPMVTDADPRTVTVTLNERDFQIVNGEYKSAVTPDSTTQEFIRIFGEPVYGDLDNDGDDDAAMLLQYSGGGTGVFYYAVLAMLDQDTYRTTNTLLLGDRIAPQNVLIQDDRAVFNFADRAADEPMSTPASIGRTVRIAYDATTKEISEWVWGVGDNAPVTERYKGQIDRVEVVFEHQAYTSYRLTTNGVMREGELNTERGFEDDADATVYVLNWRAPEGEQLRYVRFTDEPNTLYLLDSEQKIVTSSVLTLE